MLYVLCICSDNYHIYISMCEISHFCVFNFFHLKELQEKKLFQKIVLDDVG